MSASFPTSVKTFATRNAGDAIQPAHINDAQDEITAIETSLLTVGTWTPSVGGTATYTAQSGTYVQVGKQVTLNAHVTINAIGTGSTGVLSGVPFSASTLTAGTVGFFAGAASNLTFVSCYVSGTSLVITGIGAAGSAMSNPAAFFGNGADIYFSITYVSA